MNCLRSWSIIGIRFRQTQIYDLLVESGVLYHGIPLSEPYTAANYRLENEWNLF